MNFLVIALSAMVCGQASITTSATPAGVDQALPPLPAASTPAPIAASSLSSAGTTGESASLANPLTAAELEQLEPEILTAPSATSNMALPPTEIPPTYAGIPAQTTRGLFESDHAFDGFSTPLSNPVQSKDPRSLTELRFLYLGDYSRNSTPVIGGGTLQVYALQFRLALTERLQLYADKDGLAMVSPKGGRSIFGMANLMAGAKYVFIRDEENQFLFSGALQYEAPTGYPSILEGHGNGLLGVYGIVGKQFAENWHIISTFGQNIALNNSNSGYFMWTGHLDRRFGKFVPFYEANWFYYNQSGQHEPTLGIEGGGWINIGSGKVMGLNYVTNAVGFNYEFSQHVIFGAAYEYQLTSRTMLMNNMINAQLIFRY